MKNSQLRHPLRWIAPLYYAQGLPYGVVMLMAPVYFTAKGASLEAIGLAALLGLPWNLKLLWSPLTDLLGRRRNWVVATLILLLLGIGFLALTSELPLGDAQIAGVGALPRAALWSAALLLLIAVASATADISEDAFYMDALNERDQALYIGARVTAYRIAMLTASGLLVYLAGRWGWTVGYGLAALLMALFVFWNQAVLPYPSQRRPSYEGWAGFFGEFGRAFATYLRRERVMIVILFILTYKIGEVMLGRMAVPLFMKQFGVTTAQMGMISGVFGVGATILGAIAGSVWIVRRGLWFGLISITLAMGGTNLLYIWLAGLEYASLTLIGVVHAVENFAGGLGSAAFAYFLIRTCSQNYRASHYAIATGLMSLGGTLAASLSGFVTSRIGYAPYFMLCTVLSVPGIVLLFFLPHGLVGRGRGFANGATPGGHEG